MTDLKFDDKGLITVVVQDWITNEVLMVAWANQEAVDLMRALDGWIAKQPDDAMRATVRAVQLKEQRRGDSD